MSIYRNFKLFFSLFMCSLILIFNPLNIGSFSVESAKAQAKVNDSDLILLRNNIRNWANKYRCDGITPIKGNPDGCSKPGGSSGVGDSALFSGLLCYSGEKWACQNIEALKDGQGGLWRSPQRLRDRFGSTGIARFSQDQMLGVLLYLVSEKKYGDPNKARDFANHWGSWMDNHTGPNPLGHFVMCPGSLGDADACDLEIFYRARIVRHVFDYVGANAPQRGNSITGKYRLGDGDGDGTQGFMNYLGGLCSFNQDFHCHLAAVTSLILQETGTDKRPGVNSDFQQNPFSQWVNSGRQQNDNVRQSAFKYCSSVNDSYQRGINQRNRFQWMWERADREQPNIGNDSFGWDCVAMINFLKPNPDEITNPVRVDQVIGNGGWTESIAVADGYVYLATREGQLRRGKISSNVGTELIGNGGWTGSIAVADGFVYLADAAGDLRRGKISSNVGTELIGNGGWTGSIAVADGYIFLTTPNGQLLRGHL